MTTATPETVLSATDRGDDMQRRLRYQASCAALYGLKLLELESELEEIFCEQHEDVLLKRKDGRFVGVQVKTRADGLEPLKASDPMVLSSLRRFVELEIQFPAQFERFVLFSNGGVWRRERSAHNLAYLLELARTPFEDDTDQRPLKTFTERCVKNLFTAAFKKRFPLDKPALIVLTQKVLGKTHVEEETPGLNDMESRLVKCLNALSEFQGRRYDELSRAIRSLTQASFEAASLVGIDSLTAYVALANNPAEARAQTIVDGKRLTSAKILELLRGQLQPSALLRANSQIAVTELPPGMRRMELKMSAGGLSATNIDLAKDLRNSTETLLLEWLHKYGSAQANTRYEHLHTLVRVECQEAYDQIVQPNTLFGDQLLKEIRQRLNECQQREQDKLWGCRYEHLLGMTGLLTEECKLWWSEEFPLPEATSL